MHSTPAMRYGDYLARPQILCSIYLPQLGEVGEGKMVFKSVISLEFMYRIYVFLIWVGVVAVWH